METLQIRVPKSIIKQADYLVRLGFYANRSDLIRESLRLFLIQRKFLGMTPFIVGPFNDQEMKIVQNIPVESLRATDPIAEKIKAQLKSLRID